MIEKKSPVALLIVAAGSSSRMGKIGKKEYLPLNGGTVLSCVADVFLKALDFDVVVVCHPKGDARKCEAALGTLPRSLGEKLILVEGGATRQESVFNGLNAISHSVESTVGGGSVSASHGAAVGADENLIVFIHDGARPFVTEKIIADSYEAALKYGAAVPAITPVDTQKEIDENGFIKRHLARASLGAVQTPQVFKFRPLLAAHEKAKVTSDGGEIFTDDTEIWDRFSGEGRTKVVAGDLGNIKITTPGDLKLIINNCLFEQHIRCMNLLNNSL